MDQKNINSFQNTIYQYYQNHGRVLPWRKTRNPYHIFISEIMLQQTHVARVCEKYPLFIKEFPDFASLARAPLKKILNVWQGMGYNRRAVLLKKAATMVVNTYKGKLPKEIDKLITFPGVGQATAGAIMAFAFNKPVVFIETNIRTVFIHFFFRNKKHITDKQIRALVEKTLDRDNPRQWYWALMDYGAMLKKEYENPSQKSAHYSKQAPFKGSDRQVRGMIIRALINTSSTERQLAQKINANAFTIKKAVLALCKDGLIKKSGNTYVIK